MAIRGHPRSSISVSMERGWNPLKCWEEVSAAQNQTKECCHCMRLESCKCDKIRLRPGYCAPDPQGSLQRSPRPLAGFVSREGRGRERREREGKKRGGDGRGREGRGEEGR